MNTIPAMNPLTKAVPFVLGAILTASAQDKEFSWHDKGVTPYIASQIDPRFSYMLYIPKGYQENGTETYRLLVLVHGTERRPDVYIDHFRDFADKNDVILLAPLFPLNTHGRQDLENYKPSTTRPPATISSSSAWSMKPPPCRLHLRPRHGHPH